MSDEFQIFQQYKRSNWVRLRTLVTLRWFAVAGQALAVFVAISAYDIQINVLPVALTILSSVAANVMSSALYPENKRLSERDATFMLVFDVVQLGLLLYLTGGLNNPFALLILAPVTIASTVLGLRSMSIVGGTAIIIVTLISSSHVPLQLIDGGALMLPALFQFGFWVSLVIGVVFLAIYARQVTVEMHAMGDALVATQLALAREQKLTDLGGVVAAAAHELGTPLATIKLVSSELIEELDNDSELREDAELIRDQANRCREILHSMGRAGKNDLHLRMAPIEAIVNEAAEPHLERGKRVTIAITANQNSGVAQPTIYRQPEIIHGLRNLIQNAVDFAQTRVEVQIRWTATEINIRITDDGPGFPSSVLGRIGDPFVRRKRGTLDAITRPEYDGMGLGLFIAKTLLERSGARLNFHNDGYGSQSGQNLSGAVVDVVWPTRAVGRPDSETSAALGKNQPFLP